MNDEVPHIGEVREGHIWTGGDWVPVVEGKPAEAGTELAPPPPPAASASSTEGPIAPGTTPTGVSGNRRKWLVGAGVAAVAVVGAVIYFATSGGSTTVSGTFTLYDDSAFRQQCSSSVNYPDISPNTQVLLKDQSGTILGSAQLGSGTPIYVPGGGGNLPTCRFNFQFTGVPDNKSNYSLEIANRGAIVDSQSELAASGWHFQTQLGQ